MSDKFFIERRPDGRYNVEKPNAERPSAVVDTQAEAIDRARQMNPDATLHVERVRDVGPWSRQVSQIVMLFEMVRA